MSLISAVTKITFSPQSSVILLRFDKGLGIGAVRLPMPMALHTVGAATLLRTAGPLSTDGRDLFSSTLQSVDVSLRPERVARYWFASTSSDNGTGRGARNSGVWLT